MRRCVRNKAFPPLLETGTDNSGHDPGTDPAKPILVAIKGTVFDVSRNEAYAPNGTYHGMYSCGGLYFRTPSL